MGIEAQVKWYCEKLNELLEQHPNDNSFFELYDPVGAYANKDDIESERPPGIKEIESE